MNNSRKSLKIAIPVPILILVVIAIIIAIIFFALNSSESNEELFWKYFAQASDVTQVILSDKLNAQENFKETNSYTSNGNVAVVLTQGEVSSKRFNVSTSARHDVNTNRTYSDITLKNGELDVFKVAYARNGDIYGIKCDEIFDGYVGIQNFNLTALGASYGIDNVPDTIDKNNYINLFELTDAQKQHLADIYLPIIMQHITSESYQKTEETIEINGTSYNTNVYKIELTSDNVYSILVDCINTLKTDTETLMLVSDKLSKLGLGTEYTDTANLSQKLDELVGQLQIQDNLIITIYENDETNIRTNIVFGSKASITYERIGNISNFNADISYQTAINEEGGEEIIDLNTLTQASSNTTRIIIDINIDESTTTSNIQIIPDVQNSEEDINIQINLGVVQNDSITNSGSITINKVEDEKQYTTTITYDNNIAKADTVEEIEELSGSNTAIANNYTPEQFTAFIKTWTDIFIDKLSEKMTTLGLEEISNELNQINIE